MILRNKTKKLIMALASLTVLGAATFGVVKLFTKKQFKIDLIISGPRLSSVNFTYLGDTGNNKVAGFFREGILKKSNTTLESKFQQAEENLEYKNYVPYVEYSNPDDINGIAEFQEFNTTSVLGMNRKTYKPRVAFFSSFHKTGSERIDPKTGELKGVVSTFKKIGGLSLSDFAAGQADYLQVSQDNEVRARVNPDAYWSNGDKVRAQDFVDTLKYVLNLKNASPGAQAILETSKLKGVKDIWNAQMKGKSFEQAWRDAAAKDNVPAIAEGSDGRWVHYFYDAEKKAVTSPFTAWTKNESHLKLAAGYIYMPSNKKFIESNGGFSKYGQTFERTIGNGPYKIIDMDPDYALTFERDTKNYHSPELIFLNHLMYRVSPDPSIQLILFKKGQLSSMDVQDAYLQPFLNDPILSKMLQVGTSTPSVQGISFSTKYSKAHPDIDSSHNKFRQALYYGLNRNRLIKLTSTYGMAPASSVYSPRMNAKLKDEDGNVYFNGLKDAKMSPINEKGDAYQENSQNIDVSFEAFKSNEKIQAMDVPVQNSNFHDVAFKPKLAKKIMQEYLESQHKSQASLKIAISSADENGFLAIQENFKQTFGDMLKVDYDLYSTQVFQELTFSGDYESTIASYSAAFDDPWQNYSKFILEDGIDPTAPAGEKYYKDASGTRNIQVTRDMWFIPEFNMTQYIKDRIQEISTSAGISLQEATTKWFDSLHVAQAPELRAKYILALEEAKLKAAPQTGKTQPLHKYGVRDTLTTASTDLKYRTSSDPKSLDPDKELYVYENCLSPSSGASHWQEGSIRSCSVSPAYSNTSWVNFLGGTDLKSSVFPGSTNPTSYKLFKSVKDIFDWYRFIEKVIRDSGMFIPYKGVKSGYQANRAYGLVPGDTQGSPIGYATLYPADKEDKVSEIEKLFFQQTKVQIVLRRMAL